MRPRHSTALGVTSHRKASGLGSRRMTKAAAAAEAALEKRASGQRSASAAAARKAVEGYAMRMASRHFELRGFAVTDRSGNSSFDLECRKKDHTLLVEVKGTQTPGDEIILTYNEVRLAQDDDSTMALFVQHGIELEKEGDRLVATGGHTRVIEPWVPKDDWLTPIAYRCRIS